MHSRSIWVCACPSVHALNVRRCPHCHEEKGEEPPPPSRDNFWEGWPADNSVDTGDPWDV